MPEDLQPIIAELEGILVEARDDWRRKRMDYADAFLELGSKGQFSDIWRKVAKLRASVWDGRELLGEQPDEIAKDIVAHCVMLVYCYRKEHPHDHRLAPSEAETMVLKP